MHYRPFLPIGAALVALTAGATLADHHEKKKRDKKEYTSYDVIKAQPDVFFDYLAQGEYVGEVDVGEGPMQLGVQIQASLDGLGVFTAYGYPGGLPGAGWDGTGERSGPHVGHRKGDTVLFESEEVRSELKKGILKVFDGSGKQLGTLRRVERRSPTLNALPPKDAIVLYRSKADAKNWARGNKPNGDKPPEISEDGYLRRGCTTRQGFQSGKYHIEFRTPFAPGHRGQGRGNSGAYFQSRYEVQMLDSFTWDLNWGHCGGIYSIAEPRLNMCLPPLTWQTYDVEYTAAEFGEDGKLKQHARMSVWHNGVQIHKDVQLHKSTTASPKKGHTPDPAPLFLQNHGNEVVYRNVWFVPKK